MTSWWRTFAVGLILAGPYGQAAWAQPSQGAGGQTAAGRVVEAGRQVVNPNGTVVRIERLTLFPDHTEVDLLIQNGGTDEVKLNDTQGRTFMKADSEDDQYPLAAPADNKDLAVPPGQALEGTLVFIGGLPDDARQVDIIINELGSTAPTTQKPSFEFEIDVGRQSLLDVKKSRPSPDDRQA
ncbi:MAG: hypothetical protein KDG89_12305, partial [Geminicoccaceae bacterium]|nr:hypothetical protein [Geminicoccaceae bacterium]